MATDDAAGSTETMDSKAIDSILAVLCGRDRKARQNSAHMISQIASVNPGVIRGHVAELVEAMERPEAQTRWEVLDALTSLAAIDPEAASDAFEAAESCLYDEESAMLRYTAFRFFAKLAAASDEWSVRVWPLLDETLQCYHGDPEFTGMLDAVIDLARSGVDPAVSKAMADRMKFDAQAGKSPLAYRARQIIEICNAAR